MEVQLQLCHLFLLYAFWGLHISNENFYTYGSASRKFHHNNWGRNKCSPFCSLLLFIRCKFEVTVYLFKFMYFFVYYLLNIKKTIIKLARPMRIVTPVTIGFTSPCTTTQFFFLLNSLEAIDLALLFLTLVFWNNFPANHVHHLTCPKVFKHT